MDNFIAHARKNDDGSWELHYLNDHLRDVAVLGKSYADQFGNGDWAELASLWHDLGKFLPAWQSYIRRETGYDLDAHCEDGSGRPNHSTAGAVLALERFKCHPWGWLLAYLIAGHHAGLPDLTPELQTGGDLQNRLFDTPMQTMKTAELDLVRKSLNINGILDARVPKTFPLKLTTSESAQKNREHLHLWVRMLFSCLVDADFLDTERFMTPEVFYKRGDYPSLEELSIKLDDYMERKNSSVLQTPLNHARAAILKQCCKMAEMPAGFFSLTVPTGGGKTLSSMAFALKHALKHGKKRVIMAIPFTSIIEQTASVYQDVFGKDAILEHHSNIDPDKDKESSKSRVASENWDAPVVVTTNVQLFESLLASRSSSCRKLHNIVNSVIILDEAQMLPSEYLRPILSVLRGLVEHFGVTVVMCTATQPALSGKIGSGTATFQGLPPALEIIKQDDLSPDIFKRYDVVLPDMTRRIEWTELADGLSKYPQVLCIVNTRRDCQDLHRLMREGTIHLSANMCGEERSDVIAVIKKKLLAREEIRVVSTQLVEAGVDIDFPVVYRALAGLDSIAQAAGRCNREGLLKGEGRFGKVVVFVPPKPAPIGLLRKGEDTSKSFLAGKESINLNPETYRQYFEAFYRSANGFDKSKFDQRLVSGADACKFQFRTFANEVRLIDDKAQRGIIVFYDGERHSSLSLIEQLRRIGPEKWLLRKLQRFIVNVPLPIFEKLAREGHLEDIHGYWVQRSTGLYRRGYGLLPDPSMWDNDIFQI